MAVPGRSALVVALGWAAVAVAGAGASAAAEEPLAWSRLPELPRAAAGAFAGIGGGVGEGEAVEEEATEGRGVLLVAGGLVAAESFARDAGGAAVSDEVLLLEAGASAWKRVGTLPRPTAHGASISCREGLACLGGFDGARFLRDAYVLAGSDGALVRRDLPPLPRACAFMAGARIADALYVAGGRESPDSERVLGTFWRLDLSRPASERAWEDLEAWPGPARRSPALAAQGGALLFGGGARSAARQGSADLWEVLADAYLYDPRRGWRAIASLPHPVAFAAAAPLGGTHVLLFGGRERASAAAPRREVLAYESVTDTWRTLGELPDPLAAATAVPWRRREKGSVVESIVLAGGTDPSGRGAKSVLQAASPHRQSPFHALDYAVLLVYLLALVGIGLRFSRREKTTDDYFLAGRRIPWWAATLSIFGTYLSAVTFMAIPAKAYASDWVSILMNLGIILVAPVTVFCFLPFFRRLGLTTIYEYLELRFGPAARLYGSLSFMTYQLGRMGIYLLLPALALATVTGFDVSLCIAGMGVLCIFYTVLGGIEAVVWTDVLQSFVFLGGGLLCVAVIFLREGFDIAEMLEVAASENKFHVFTTSGGLASTVFWVVILGGFFTQLVPFTSDQGLTQRYLTTPSERSAARAVWTHAAIVVPASLLFFGLGTALFVFYKARPELLDPVADSSDIILPWFVATQLPPGLAGLVIAGLFAATMSSVDTGMNSIATSLVTDLYGKARPQADDATRLGVARAVTVAVGVLATLSALFVSSLDVASLWDLILVFAGLLGSSLTGIFVLGVFTRRANGRGVAAGVIASIAALVVVRSWQPPLVHGYLYAAVGISTCVGVGYLASLCLPAAPRPLEGLTLRTLGAREEGR